MGTVDRQQEIRRAVARAITERTLPNEGYGFDIGPALVPAPAGVTAGYLLVISCKSPVLAPPRIAAAQGISDPWPDEKALGAAVGSCLGVLAQMRAKLLEVPAPAAANGRRPG